MTDEFLNAHETHHPFKVVGYYLEALPKTASHSPMQTTVRCDVTSEQAEIERLNKALDQAIGIGYLELAESGRLIKDIRGTLFFCEDNQELADELKKREEAI